jgi:hypothetical protein
MKMKASVAKSFKSIVADLKKVADYLAAAKVKKAQAKVASLSGKLEKKLAKAKSPKPRKPSAYSLFVKKNYKSVAAANPGKSFASISKLLAKLYKERAASPKPASPKPAKASPKPKAVKARKPSSKKSPKK